jgi:cysteine sulfinate desulfinase/cysteine desulfurase-like protein
LVPIPVTWCSPEADEGDNLAIRGVAEALEPTGRKHVIASAIEHEAVLNTLKALAGAAGPPPAVGR